MSHLDHAKIVFNHVADEQENKGIQKYGQALDPLDDYNWLEMAVEEQVDGFKYLTAEMEKRAYIVSMIRTVTDDPYINHLLDRLEGK